MRRYLRILTAGLLAAVFLLLINFGLWSMAAGEKNMLFFVPVWFGCFFTTVFYASCRRFGFLCGLARWYLAIAIAWVIVEYIVDHIGIKLLFPPHAGMTLWTLIVLFPCVFVWICLYTWSFRWLLRASFRIVKASPEEERLVRERLWKTALRRAAKNRAREDERGFSRMLESLPEDLRDELLEKRRKYKVRREN